MISGTQSDLIRHLKSEYGKECTRAAICQLVKAKDFRIQFTPGGKIIIDKTAKALVDSGFPKVQSNKKKKDSATIFPKLPFSEVRKAVENVYDPDKESDETDIPTEEEVASNPLKTTDPREKIDKYLLFQRYEKERIANEKSKKELVNFNQTSDTVFNFFRSLRDDLLEVGKRTSPTANMSPTKQEAKKIIDDEIHRIIASKVGERYQFDDELKKKIIQILRV